MTALKLVPGLDSRDAGRVARREGPSQISPRRATAPCIFCGVAADGTVVGEVGGERGPLCGDCAYWCDGNVITVPDRRPREGSMAWVRAFFDRRIRRGALVEHNGYAAHILSASNGFLYLRVWKTGARVAVRPYEVSFPTT